MCNYHLRDQGLSLKGKGLLSMLLSLPDTWNYSVRGLSSITPDGVDGVLTALKELERLGYLERNQQDVYKRQVAEATAPRRENVPRHILFYKDGPHRRSCERRPSPLRYFL